MRLNSTSARLLRGVALMVGCAQLAFAGAAFPCPTAVNSKYSNALAITHATVDWEHDQTGKVVSGRTRRVSITVMTKQRFINAQHRMSAPVTYWGEFPWEIVLDGKNKADSRWFCPMPLVTDDGQFLILLRVEPLSEHRRSYLSTRRFARPNGRWHGEGILNQRDCTRRNLATIEN